MLVVAYPAEPDRESLQYQCALGRTDRKGVKAQACVGFNTIGTNKKPPENGGVLLGLAALAGGG